jgi:hypothetical protein
MLVPSIVIFLAFFMVSLSFNCTSNIVGRCIITNWLIWIGMTIAPVGTFALIRGIVLLSENHKKKLKLHDKVTTISDDDKSTFNLLWANHLTNNLSVEDDYKLRDFILYMAREYSFDYDNFQLVDKEGNLVHMRIPKI